MFERFTDRARRTLALAQEEARFLGHGFIGTEHILLGLLHEGEGVAAKVLTTSFGVTLTAVRTEVERILGIPGEKDETSSPPFTPRAKKVLELALREALQLGHSYIGTEHLLLGLAREGEGVAVQVLVALGADPARIRQQVLQVMTRGDPRARVRRSRGLLGSSTGYAPLSHSPVWREEPDACSLCGRDLFEVAHYVEAEEVRVCDECIRAAADVLEAAGTEPRELVLPPRVFGDPPDAKSVDELLGAVRALVGPPDERSHRANVVEDAEGLEPHLRALDVRLAGRARVSRIRFVSADTAELRFHFRVVGEDAEITLRGEAARVVGRWTIARAAVVEAMERAGLRVEPTDP